MSNFTLPWKEVFLCQETILKLCKDSKIQLSVEAQYPEEFGLAAKVIRTSNQCRLLLEEYPDFTLQNSFQICAEHLNSEYSVVALFLTTKAGKLPMRYLDCLKESETMQIILPTTIFLKLLYIFKFIVPKNYLTYPEDNLFQVEQLTYLSTNECLSVEGSPSHQIYKRKTLEKISSDVYINVIFFYDFNKKLCPFLEFFNQREKKVLDWLYLPCKALLEMAKCFEDCMAQDLIESGKNANVLKDYLKQSQASTFHGETFAFNSEAETIHFLPQDPLSAVVYQTLRDQELIDNLYETFTIDNSQPLSLVNTLVEPSPASSEKKLKKSKKPRLK